MQDSSSGRNIDTSEKSPLSDQIFVEILSLARPCLLARLHHIVDSTIAEIQEAIGLLNIEMIDIEPSKSP